MDKLEGRGKKQSKSVIYSGGGRVKSDPLIDVHEMFVILKLTDANDVPKVGWIDEWTGCQSLNNSCTCKC